VSTGNKPAVRPQWLVHPKRNGSVAAALLVEQGYEVVGLYMCAGLSEDAPVPAGTEHEGRHLGCCSPLDAADARAAAQHLGIGLYALDFRGPFDELIDYFADEYARGRTPNPCILCNRDLKFGRLVAYGRAAGADYIATGHYCRILPRTLFPLGHLTKQEVREHARRVGLKISNKPESQDICFAPDRDYARIVRRRRPEAFREGPVLDETGREVGRHPGLAYFTIGQRRGLGVAMGIPYYVTALDVPRNAVIIGPEDKLASDYLEASAVRWLIDPPAAPVRATVQIRYTHPGALATVEPVGNNRVRVRFDVPQRAITPGQAAVFYDNDVVLGGGFIDVPRRP